jgi:hypothetical protein
LLFCLDNYFYMVVIKRLMPAQLNHPEILNLFRVFCNSLTEKDSLQ